jgi:hypothetical protein
MKTKLDTHAEKDTGKRGKDVGNKKAHVGFYCFLQVGLLRWTKFYHIYLD